MVSELEFLEIFRNSKKIIIPEEELITFYHSIQKSVIYYHAGFWANPQLLELEERDQWPVLKFISDPKLDIYKEADREMLQDFIKTIKKEIEIRKNGKKIPGSGWKFRENIKARTNLYKEIFVFTDEEVQFCKDEAKRIRDEIIQERKRVLIETGFEAVKNAIKKVITKKEEKDNKTSDKK